jgi:hypothetical protein
VRCDGCGPVTGLAPSRRPGRRVAAPDFCDDLARLIGRFAALAPHQSGAGPDRNGLDTFPALRSLLHTAGPLETLVQEAGSTPATSADRCPTIASTRSAPPDAVSWPPGSTPPTSKRMAADWLRCIAHQPARLCNVGMRPRLIPSAAAVCPQEARGPQSPGIGDARRGSGLT